MSMISYFLQFKIIQVFQYNLKTKMVTNRRSLRTTSPWALKLLIFSLCGLALFRAAETTRQPWYHRALQEDDSGLDEDNNQIIEGVDAPKDMDGQDVEPAPIPTRAEPVVPVPSTEPSTAPTESRHRTNFNVSKDNMTDFEIEDVQDRYRRGEYKLDMLSLNPRGGPITGGTQVTVRMSNLGPFVDAYPAPKCKFGKNNKIVDAGYIRCTEKPPTFYAKESKSGSSDLNHACVQCEGSPIYENAEIISVTVSLTGNFEDSSSSLPYRYYNKLQVTGIYPRYGPKDGDTVIQVWGKNFIDLGDDFRCNFGVKSTKAHFIDSGYLWCRAPSSDVVNRPMPFSVSMNRQQNSQERLSYWYYNHQVLSKVTPDFGAIQGDQKLVLRGSSFKPFDWSNDIDNQNDTFCNFGPLGKTPAHVVSETEAECLTPSNNQHITVVPLRLTLNNQNYTDESIEFTYFNPPLVVDTEPLLGPIRGGTVVNFWGSSFERKNITCMFGTKEVRGVYISKQHLTCTSPNVTQPGTVPLTIKYSKDRFNSDTFTYEYFSDPVVNSVEPACGPLEGYTQLTVSGSNFKEMGFGKAKCIFNETLFMNATVIDSTTLVCDSPPFESVNPEQWYNIAVTLDGDYVSPSSGVFNYYRQPKISSISPWTGPLSGGTVSTVTGHGFNQTNICNFVVRFEQKHLLATDRVDKSFQVVSPAVNVSGAVVVSVSGNNQQFINDITLHFRDDQNTFEYYQDFLIQSIKPEALSNAGNSPLRINGMLFDQWKYNNASDKNLQLQCRFADSSSDLSNPTLIGSAINMTRITDTQQLCVAPKTEAVGEARLELSANGQQWMDSKQRVQFYNGPRVTAVNPTYGVTKNPRGLNIAITGNNFVCPQGDCTKLKVRFTNERGDKIFEDAIMRADGAVECKIPKYPAPETLDVDVSFNGIDFTNDGVKYGFMDPYVLDIKPKLISSKGTTEVTMYGYGFVQMEESSSVIQMMQGGNALTCNGSPGTKVYSVINEHQVKAGTFEQAACGASSSSWNLFMKNPDGYFSSNTVDLFYYKDLILTSFSAQFAYANEEKPILIKTDFSWGNGNDFKLFRKYATLTCRFSSDSQTIVIPAVMEASPIGAYDNNQNPNQIRCNTPKWNRTETVTVEVSVNGQDYMGNYQLVIVEPLKIMKLSPMAGPIGGNTQVKLFGSGFTSSLPKETEVLVKFGDFERQQLDKKSVTEISWSEDAFYEGLHLSKSSLHNAEENDYPLSSGDSIKAYISAVTPDVSRDYSEEKYTHGMGGPVYVQLQERVAIKAIDHTSARKGEITEYVDTTYPDSSSLEYYFYRQPFVKKIEPSSGLAQGGTLLSVTGGWFQQVPEYGVFPFCKIGASIIKAKFVQTNRILCKTPPSVDLSAPLAVAVSLNGVDFVDTGFTFSYYERPEIVDVQPRSGSIEGGTELWLKGSKFSNITHGMKTVRCRFRQVMPKNASSDAEFDEDNVPTKFIPAYYIDKETMKCASPSGWHGGDQVLVDLTFNGVDYTENNYVFSFYNIYGSFPKSGPADATNQFIQIRGKGFRSESIILCSLNGVEVAPLQVKDSVIKCPMVLDNWPSDKYESVPFDIKIDGSTHAFGNFHYFQQIVIDEVSPLLGPNDGSGAIYFTGKNFRTDFENSNLGCRIGNKVGSAMLVDFETIRCTISNKLDLVDEGQSLPVSVSLNQYSWAASEFSFTPYGILDMYPTSGPVNENTNIIVVGKGFANDMQDFARCKFGTEDNYIIVEGQVLDDEHLICKSPSEAISLPDGSSEEVTLPFSIAFQDDIYFPYTQGTQKFRLYQHPLTVDIYPDSTTVSRLSEVYITADEDQGFKQSIPAAGHNSIYQDDFGIKCKFGRFGTSVATYINHTTILCLTPNIQDDPSDISEETVSVSVAMNGIDFNDDFTQVEFTFVGTGANISTFVIIMGTLIFGLLIVSIMIFLSGIQEYMKESKRVNNLQSYTQAREGGGLQPRVASRASSAGLQSRQFNPSRSGQPVRAGSRASSSGMGNALRFGQSSAAQYNAGSSQNNQNLQ